jgi:hypothetical protein
MKDLDGEALDRRRDSRPGPRNIAFTSLRDRAPPRAHSGGLVAGLEGDTGLLAVESSPAE